MKKKPQSAATELAALRQELAALRAKLARPTAGQKPRNGQPLSTKQRNDLRAAAKRIARAWHDLELPGEAWLAAQLDALPQELRTLRDDAEWRTVIERYIERSWRVLRVLWEVSE